MINFKNKLCSLSIILAAVAAGMLIFLAAVINRTDAEFLSSSRHMKLLSSYDIYDKAGAAVENALNSYMPINGGSAVPVSPDIIRLNVDSIVNGMLLYFKGDTAFLPDIHLNPTGSATSEEMGKSLENSEKLTFKAMSDIDKVNLSAIIMYTNRQDISDVLLFIRLLHYVAQKIPVLLLIIIIFCILYIISMAKSRRELILAGVVIVGAAGLSGIVVLATLYYWLKALLPSFIGILSLSLPLSGDTIISYIIDLFKPLILFLLLMGLLFPISLLVLKKNVMNNKSRSSSLNPLHYCGARLKYILGILIVMMLFIAAFKTFALLEDFKKKGFVSVYEKVTCANTQMKVIPAMNDNIYTLEMKLIDKNNGAPVPEALIELEGKTSVDEKFINLNMLSDTEGTARFNVQAGTFRIGFIPEMFPDDFKLPAPLYVKINTAGTTTITVSLEEAVNEPKLRATN